MALADPGGAARSPQYAAIHAPRYERQTLIRQYQDEHKCRLIVVSDILMPNSVALFEETLHGANPSEDLHVMLATPGGDGETAIRLARQAQSRCNTLTVIVPDQAKSAGTLFALGADHIYMGPTSDLGPVDPQLLLPDGSLGAARAIIAAVEDAEERIQANPNTYPLHVALLADVSALMVQQARDALARTAAQVREALLCVQTRTKCGVKKMAKNLDGHLIGDIQSHGATISASAARGFGLPVKEATHGEPQWLDLWRLWAKYRILGNVQVYEGEKASVVRRRDINSSGRNRQREERAP